MCFGINPSISSNCTAFRDHFTHNGLNPFCHSTKVRLIYILIGQNNGRQVCQKCECAKMSVRKWKWRRRRIITAQVHKLLCFIVWLSLCLLLLLLLLLLWQWKKGRSIAEWNNKLFSIANNEVVSLDVIPTVQGSIRSFSIWMRVLVMTLMRQPTNSVCISHAWIHLWISMQHVQLVHSYTNTPPRCVPNKHCPSGWKK